MNLFFNNLRTTKNISMNKNVDIKFIAHDAFLE
jgi:hypothetical protein